MKEALTSKEFRDKPIGIDEKWEPLCYTDATPNEDYVLRILRAHLANCETGRWQGSNKDLINKMNEWQDKRAELLREAIDKLESK